MDLHIAPYLVWVLLLTGLWQGCALDREQRVDRLFQPYQGSDVPGAAVMIIQDGQPILLKSYGMADLERSVPVSNTTNFRLASLTKQFTAMAIMILAESGKLSYDMTLTEIFADFPEYGHRITIRQLLQHRSGLIDYEELIPDTASQQVTDKDVLHMVMQQDSTYFPPGTQYRYSNSGYAVLAMVVETRSGHSFAEFLAQHIFSPLEMYRTVAYQKGVSRVPNRAYGYHVMPDSISFSDQSLTSAVLGDGGVYSSLDDLYKWDQALYHAPLVSEKTLQLAFTPALENYGFGWRIDSYHGHQRLHHSGSTCGFRNVIQRYPEAHFTVIILTNRREPDVAPLADRLTDWYLTPK